MAIQIVLGWFVIDFITGIYHYILDHTPTHWPIIGKQARDFQDHHLDPNSMEKHGIIARCWMPALASLFALCFAYFGYSAFWITVWFGGTISQQAHHWAHRGRRAPWIIRKLQQIGILLSLEQHMRHHRDFTRCFGILNGWSHGMFNLLLGRSQ